MTTTTAIAGRAQEARDWFETATRPDDSRYWRKKHECPEWIEEMVHAAHDDGDMLPDDYRYEYIVNALDLLADGVDPAEPEIEADPYTHDLTEWMGSHSWRREYVNDAIKDLDIKDINHAMMEGQVAEKTEIFHAVVRALEEREDE
jgi:hypothetical protein